MTFLTLFFYIHILLTVNFTIPFANYNIQEVLTKINKIRLILPQNHNTNVKVVFIETHVEIDAAKSI